jgi:hypothetical protein
MRAIVLAMPEPADVELGYFRGPLDIVLAALESAHLDGAVLELDPGGSRELDELVDDATRDWPELAEANRSKRRPVRRSWPIELHGARVLSLPIERDNLARLRSVASRDADPAIAIHLVVRDDVGYLIEAWDVGNNEVLVSSRLPPASVDAFRDALGEHLRRR